MATTKRELSCKVNSAGKSEIIIRLSIGRGAQYRLKTGLFIIPARFKDGVIVKPRANQKEAAELRVLESEVNDIEQYLLDLCANATKEELSKEIVIDRLDRYRFRRSMSTRLLCHFSMLSTNISALTRFRLRW